MTYAILRTAKLKTVGQLAGSLSHTHRTRHTPNADPSRLSDNEHFGPREPGAIRAALLARLPAKRRKDAVICLEYFIGASPEYFRGGQDGAAYFAKALRWLKAKHGAENVIAASVHRDETSPHLVAYVVPITTDGRLCAKDFVGGKAKLSQLQSDFAHQVGAEFGLQRGIEGSRATHTTIREYYRALSHPDFKHGRLKPAALTPKVLQKGIWRRIEESPEQIADRVTSMMQKHYEPVVQQAATSQIAQRRAEQLAKTAREKQAQLKAEQAGREAAEREAATLREVFLDGLSDAQRRWLADMAREMREDNILAENKMLEARERESRAKRSRAPSASKGLGL